MTWREFRQFALVIPVPEVIPEDKVKVLEPELFDRLDAYSQPRLVTYTCEDFEERWDTGLDFDSSVPEASGDPEDNDVNVELCTSLVSLKLSSSQQRNQVVFLLG